MTQNTETTRAAIVAVMRAVPEIGVVNTYERYAKDTAGMRRIYTVQVSAGEQLRGWFVRRLAARTTRNGTGRAVVQTSWHIRGFMALADADESEIVFDGLIDAVRRAIYADPTLNGAVMSTLFEKEAGAQLQASGPVMFAGVLCHSADLVLTTETLE
ncbi:MAG: hypothetical protein NDI70_07850 [Pseudomonas sagittaria]|nr:hypothetical protein [Pseudomonas sagittaria]